MGWSHLCPYGAGLADLSCHRRGGQQGKKHQERLGECAELCIPQGWSQNICQGSPTSAGGEVSGGGRNHHPLSDVPVACLQDGAKNPAPQGLPFAPCPTPGFVLVSQEMEAAATVPCGCHPLLPSIHVAAGGPPCWGTPLSPKQRLPGGDLQSPAACPLTRLGVNTPHGFKRRNQNNKSEPGITNPNPE